MSDIAIKVENLSKRYRIGRQEQVHDTMVGALLDFLKRPGANLRRLRRLTRFSDNGHEPEDVIWALKDVSFEVKQGEVVGVIGSNGAGKSTLLKILSRITHPTGGRVELRGRVSSLLEVGTGFHPELTGRENIYLNGTILGMRKTEIDRKFDEMVDFSEVEKFIDTPVKRYSSGMRVRLAFAVAAHLEPEILLVDEVLAVGDFAFQKKCIGKMKEVATFGRTVLFVSHDMAAITRLCPKVMLFESGQLLVSGPSDRVVDQYLNSGVEDYALIQKLTSEKDALDFWLTHALFLDKQGNPTKVARSGEEISIALGYETKYSSMRNMNWVRVHLFDINGNPLFVCNSRLSEHKQLTMPSKGTLLCTIPKLPLIPGEYLISFSCKNDENHIMSYEHFLKLTVAEGSFFPNGHFPHRKHGAFLTEYSWDIIENAMEEKEFI